MTGFRATLLYLIPGLYGDDYKEEQWVEPNRLKYLFRGNDKWSPEDGIVLAYRTCKYLGYTT